MDETLLDTDILNEVLKQKNAHVVRHAAAYLAQHGQFAISSITRYEVLRGLKEKQAVAQLANFQVFCQHTLILPVTDSILDQAADLWANGRARGLAPKTPISSSPPLPSNTAARWSPAIPPTSPGYQGFHSPTGATRSRRDYRKVACPIFDFGAVKPIMFTADRAGA